MTPSQHQILRVFIENEAGSDTKHHYDEDTFEVLRTETVGARYPYPYGFVPGTLAPDGDAADCFVITDATFTTGSFVECAPIALLEQTEGGDTDHNVIAVIPGEPTPDLAEVEAAISLFVKQFRAGFPGQEAEAGRLLPVEHAINYIAACTVAHAEQQANK